MSDKDEIHLKGYYTGDIHNQFVPEHYDPKNRKLIWRTFWILLIITIFEVWVSFTSVPKNILLYVFVILTLVKAYFIVGYFMHLKHERYTLIYSIVLPFALIGYLIAMALAEGVYIGFWDKLF